MNTRTIALDFDVKTDTTHDNAAALLAEANLSLKIRSLGRGTVEVLDVRPATESRIAELEGHLRTHALTAPGMAGGAIRALEAELVQRVDEVAAELRQQVAVLEAENARLRHAERRFTEERVAGLRREVEAARERVAGLEGDLASAERWLSGGTPEPLETVVPLRGRFYQRAAPGWECASVSPSGRGCVLLAHHNGMHSDGTVGWYLPHRPAGDVADAPDPFKGFVVWHRQDGECVRLYPVSDDEERTMASISFKTDGEAQVIVWRQDHPVTPG